MKDEDYPYKGKQSICRFKKPQTVVDISSWSVLPPQDEHALKVALATVGPLAVSINASPHTFQLYSSGIYNDEGCSSDYVNHAMLLIGYTRNSWILKNWWSDRWGDKGYMYLKRGHNRCGIANYAVYALL
uniref:Cathepsin K n=2 Tax=Cacopsylla melanoneura TaxID=428564 RepID=A0A8D8LVI0_9HEMI